MGLLGIPGEVIDKITRKLGLQTAVERSSFDLAATIQPIINADEDIAEIVINTTLTGGTTAVLFTTPIDVDFFLTDIDVSLSKDGAATASRAWAEVIDVFGATQRMCRLPGITTTAQDLTMTKALTTPLKLKRGSEIKLFVDASGAVFLASMGIVGFTKPS